MDIPLDFYPSGNSVLLKVELYSLLSHLTTDGANVLASSQNIWQHLQDKVGEQVDISEY